MNRRTALSIPLGLAASFALPVSWLQARSPAGRDRRAPRSLIDYWEGGGGNEPGALPGWVATKPNLHLHQRPTDPRITVAEIDLLRRRVDIAFAALMAQPSLRDVHGVSIEADLNISLMTTDDGMRLVKPILSLLAKTVHAGDPKTIVRDGRYLSPWEEGAVLRIHLNPYEFLARRGVEAEFIEGRTVRVSTGAAFGIIVSDAAHQGEWYPRDQARLLQEDKSWYRPGTSGSHMLLVHVSSYRQENDLLRQGRLQPTRGAARLAAAMFMTDWEDVQRRMVALR